MGKPHVHAEIIKQWADGAEIEYRTIYEPEWQSAGGHPAWLIGEGVEYRVKPDPRAARDMAIAKAVRDECGGCVDDLSLGYIIASVKD